MRRSTRGSSAAPRKPSVPDARPRAALLLVTVALLACAAITPAGADEDRIMAAQEALEALGYDPGPADGVAGGNTERAVRTFQEEFGLAVTGEVSAALVDRMLAEVAGGGASAEKRLERGGLLRSYTRAVQDGLRRLGYDPGPVDGLVGPMTRKAVRAWQAAAGIEVTGEISGALLASINRARGL